MYVLCIDDSFENRVEWIIWHIHNLYNYNFSNYFYTIFSEPHVQADCPFTEKNNYYIIVVAKFIVNITIL